MINIGDWVRHVDDPAMFGYVTKINIAPKVPGFEDMIYFSIFCLKRRFVEPCPVKLDKKDIAALIDLALATNDKEWFEELTRGMAKHATS